MEDPRISKLKDQLRDDLRNPAFHRMPVEHQADRVNAYIAQGVPGQDIARIINEAKQIEEQRASQQTNVPASAAAPKSLTPTQDDLSLARTLIDQLINHPENPNFLNAKFLEEISQQLGMNLDQFNELLNRIYWAFPKRRISVVNTGRGPTISIGVFHQAVTNEEARKSSDIISQNLSNYINNPANWSDLRRFANILNEYRNEISINLDPESFNAILAKLWRQPESVPHLIIRGEEVDIIGPRTVKPPSQNQQAPQIPVVRIPPEFARRLKDPAEAEMILALLLHPTLQNNPNLSSAYEMARERLGLTVRDFNALIARIWPGPGLPPVLFSGREEFESDSEDEYISDNEESQRRGGSNIEIREVIDTLEGFLHGSLEPILAKEIKQFGRGGVLVRDLNDLAHEIHDYEIDLARHVRQTRTTSISRDEFEPIFGGFISRLQEIVEAQQVMGKRCINNETPINMTPVDELGDEEYVRLNNGVCWEVPELLEYIRRKNGRNDTSDLRNYPTPRIWNDNDELEHILNLPEAKRSGFSKWLKTLTSTEATRNISEETLQRMYIAASLLASEGRPFKEAADRELRQDPRLYRVWQQIGGRANQINSIQDSKIRKELDRALAVALKSNAIAEFRNYYQSLRPEERMALAAFDPRLEAMIESCYGGNECVFGMSNTLLALRNQIARQKKLPIIDLKRD